MLSGCDKPTCMFPLLEKNKINLESVKILITFVTIIKQLQFSGWLDTMQYSSIDRGTAVNLWLAYVEVTVA